MLDFILNFLIHGITHASWVTKLVYFMIVTQLTIFSVTLYLHRSQAHRAVDFHPLLAHFFRFWSWLTTSMITREWAAIHRKHHAKCETEDDPHSPRIVGINAVMWKGVELYRAARADRPSIEKYGKGCPDDWIERHLYTAHPDWGPILMLVIDVALLGVIGVAVWAVQMLWIPFWAAGVVNGLGHWWGYRNTQTTDTSTNLTPWGVWIGGEELHNNHHAFPSSAKFALRRWEFDIGWVAIKTLEKLRLATVLRVAPTLDIRPNIALPDSETLRALLAHRFAAMTDYWRHVMRPALRAPADDGDDAPAKLPRRLRKGLADGGRWLDASARERLQAFVARRPQLATLVEFRARLATVLEERSTDAAASLQRLQAWCEQAEATGIRALQEFSARMKGYAIAVH